MCKICEKSDRFSFPSLLGNRKKFHKELEEKVGNYLGSGSEGQVFEYGDKVVKFNLDNWCGPFEKYWAGQKKMLRLLKKENSPGVVRIDSFKRIGEDHYFIVMERLDPVPWEEYDDLLEEWSFFRNPRGKNYNRLPKGSIRRNRMEQFVRDVGSLCEKHGLYYNDFHSSNVMKSKTGYKLVDVESFRVK